MRALNQADQHPTEPSFRSGKARDPASPSSPSPPAPPSHQFSQSKPRALGLGPVSGPPAHCPPGARTST